MSITDKVRAAADYDAWKQVQVQSGATEYSVSDYEQHLRATLAGDRLDMVHETVTELMATQGASEALLWATIARVKNLSDLSEENQ